MSGTMKGGGFDGNKAGVLFNMFMRLHEDCTSMALVSVWPWYGALLTSMGVNSGQMGKSAEAPAYFSLCRDGNLDTGS